MLLKFDFHLSVTQKLKLYIARYELTFTGGILYVGKLCATGTYGLRLGLQMANTFT